MSQTILIDEDTGHQIIYDPDLLDDPKYSYESCRIKLDSDLKQEIIDQETHFNLISLLNFTRTKNLGKLTDPIDIDYSTD